MIGILNLFSSVRIGVVVIATVFVATVGVARAAEQALAWDARMKEIVSKPGETNVVFTFAVTNVGEKAVAILTAKPSCGCTVVKLPSTPWMIDPGMVGELKAEVDLRGKSGELTKSILVETSAGPQILLTKVSIGGTIIKAGGENRGRMNNVVIAQANRQAVFRGECAQCHVTPAVEKTGRTLYLASCGICHEAEHRASMVPDLRHVKATKDRAYWTQWIKFGKEGSLMPAFAASKGGPLSEKQIESLLDLLEKEIPAPVPTREEGK